MAQEAEKKSAFEQATEFVRNLPKEGDLDDATKLEFYACYKQATVGKCSEKGGSQPWAVQMEARAKWDAWAGLGDLSADEAKKRYIEKLIESTKNAKDKFVPQ
eukprot:UN11576